jgi:hypothetical protein
MRAKKLIEKKPFKLVALALANKMARIAFVILRGKTTYQKSQRGGRRYGSRLTKSQGGTAPIEDAPGIIRTCEIGRLNVLQGGRALGSITRRSPADGFWRGRWTRSAAYSLETN